MVLYRYALDSKDQITQADSLAGIEHRDVYRCIACERELIARVNGSIKRPHFAHKSVGECDGETYLHKLGKQAFVETFHQCQEQGKPFMIRFTAPRVCNRFKSLTTRVCEVSDTPHEYDLTQYYTHLQTEKRDGEFIPDVSLLSTKRPDDIVYIEIAVNHFLSEEKARSGKRIIEIPVKTEEDIERIRSGVIDDQHASFKGFNPKIHVVPDAECECAKRNYYAFYVFRSGKAQLDHGSLRSLENKINRMQSLVWTRLRKEQTSDSGYGYYNDESTNTLFNTFVSQAFSEEVPFKNCYLCKYSGKSWERMNEHCVFCKLHKKSCDSNYANKCASYSVAEYHTCKYSTGY